MKNANGEIKNGENCYHCSRIRRKVQGMQIDRMKKVQCDQQVGECFDEVDSQFPDDLGRIVKEQVKTKRKKSLLKKHLREYEHEMLGRIQEKEEQQEVQCVLDKLPIRVRSPPPPPQGDHREVHSAQLPSSCEKVHGDPEQHPHRQPTPPPPSHHTTPAPSTEDLACYQSNSGQLILARDELRYLGDLSSRVRGPG